MEKRKATYLNITRTLLTAFTCTFFILNTGAQEEANPGQNLISTMAKDELNGFQWENEPEVYQIQKKSLVITASAETDFFNDPENGKVTATAPYLYKEITGDFIATILVEPDLSSVWNAAALFLYIDQDHWIKFGFENSDATGPSLVSVVTRNRSDDSNGVILKGEAKIWLRLIRKRDLYAMHWSRDGQIFKMARLAHLPASETVRIGLEAQCPVGETAIHRFLQFSIQKKTVKDLRKGD